MLDPDRKRVGIRGRRYGACHRCGWKGPVGRVSRQARNRLQSGREFGRLCDDCVDELLRPGTASELAPKMGRLKSTRNRHVA